MKQIDSLKELISQGAVDTAIQQMDQLLQGPSSVTECIPEKGRLETRLGQLPICHRPQPRQSGHTSKKNAHGYP